MHGTRQRDDRRADDHERGDIADRRATSEGSVNVGPEYDERDAEQRDEQEVEQDGANDAS